MKDLLSFALVVVKTANAITIFRMDEDGSDIDRAILRALLKAEHASAADQLSLALIWNRADIARTEIFTEDQQWKMAELEEAMMDALGNNRVKFVNLLLENGVSMHKFLTPTRLLELYNARKWCPASVVLRQILCKDKVESSFTLLDVNNAIRRLLGSSHKRRKRVQKSTIRKEIYNANQTMFVDGQHNDMRSTTNEFKPYDELLLWAVLCNIQEMALFMWERGDENLARALVAGKLYNAMARLTESDDAISDVTDDLYAHVDEFKGLALGFLDQCFRTNEDLTQQLLTYNVKNWGEQTCLSLAVSIEHEKFLAHVSCQTLLTDIWMGAIKSGRGSTIKTVTGILFPPAIFSLEFKTEQELQSMPVPEEEYDQDLAREKSGNEEQENQAFRDSRCFAEGNSAVELREFSQSNGEVLSASRELNRIPSCTSRTPEIRVVPLTWVEKIIGFYTAPVTKFWSNVFAYLAFLTLFSYLILIRQDEMPSISEIVVIVFVCSLCTEEIRQILHSEPTTLLNKVKDWASCKWNILDGFAVILFFVGLGLRLYPITRRAGHVVYCIDVMLWITRLLDIFSVSKHLGPYVVMIGRMTKDMLNFLLIMMVFLLAYGVAQQAILYPDEPATWSVLSGVFYRPYFQVYGELFMETPDTIDKSTTLLGTPRKDPHGDTIVAFIVAFYLLVANILLLNLLIAIFKELKKRRRRRQRERHLKINTYNSVEANANQIWKFQRYYLVMEYYQRPVLIPPFIVFNHVINLFKGLYHWCKNCLRQNNEDLTGLAHHYGLKLSLKESDLQKLTLFEERCVDGYLREKDTLLHATQEEKIKVIGDRMESVSCQLQDMYKESVIQFNSNKTLISSLDTRITKLEEQTHKIVGLLEKLCETGDESKGGHTRSARSVSVSDVELDGSLGYRTSKTASTGRRLKSLSEVEHISNPKNLEGFNRTCLSTAAARAKSSLAKQSRENKTTHALARQSPYPHSTQQRYPVPDFLVDWKVSFPGYDPPLYTAPEVEAFPQWADPDILDNSNFVISFNCDENGINRRSQTGMIDTVNRLPRNPMGRTGVAGRGLLGRWGPNHNVHFIVTRWKCGEDGQIFQRQGQNVLEFVAIKSQNNSELTIPGGLIELGNSVSETLGLYFKKQIFPAVTPAFSEEKALTEEIILTMVQSSVEIYEGYLDDRRNTDNAWVETVAMNFHDEKREILSVLDFEELEGVSTVLWQELSRQVKLEAATSFVLHKVAQIWNAFY